MNTVFCDGGPRTPVPIPAGFGMPTIFSDLKGPGEAQDISFILAMSSFSLTAPFADCAARAAAHDPTVTRPSPWSLAPTGTSSCSVRSRSRSRSARHTMAPIGDRTIGTPGRTQAQTARVPLTAQGWPRARRTAEAASALPALRRASSMNSASSPSSSGPVSCAAVGRGSTSCLLAGGARRRRWQGQARQRGESLGTPKPPRGRRDRPARAAHG